MLRTKLNTKDKEHKEPNKDIPEYKEPNKEKSVKKAKKTYKHIMFNDNVDVIQDKSDENVESYKYNNENMDSYIINTYSKLCLFEYSQ